MKRVVCLFCTLMLCCLTAGCAISKTFEVTGADSIVIMSGTTGESVEVTDPETVRELTENINSIEFTRRQSSKNSSGWSYSLRWYVPDGEEIESVTVQGNGTIDYDGHFWSAVSGSIDMDIFDDLLSGQYGNQ